MATIKRLVTPADIRAINKRVARLEKEGLLSLLSVSQKENPENPEKSRGNCQKTNKMEKTVKVSAFSQNAGAMSTNMFQTLIEAFRLDEEGCNYAVNEIEVHMPRPDGMMYAEQVCDADSIGGTGRWGCGCGHIDYTRLPQALKQALIKEGLFSGNVVIAHRREDGSSFLYTF